MNKLLQAFYINLDNFIESEDHIDYHPSPRYKADITKRFKVKKYQGVSYCVQAHEGLDIYSCELTKVWK